MGFLSKINPFNVSHGLAKTIGANKILKSKLFQTVAPIALSFLAPGVGTALGSALGAGAAWAPTVGNAVLGAGIGGIGGGAKGAVRGGISALMPSIIGKAAGAPLGPGVQGPVQPGSGILGAVTRGSNSAISNLARGGSLSGGGGGASGGGSGMTNLLSGLYSYGKEGEAEKKLLEAQGKSLNVINPYVRSGSAANTQLAERLATGFNPGDLTLDPGYKFRLAQGNEALDRRLAASGMSQSGAAIKAGQEFGQGLADQTYNDAYNRWLQQNQQLAGQSGQGLGAAGAASDIYGNKGNISVNALAAKSNLITQTVSDLFGGDNRRIVGYNSDGTAIYADSQDNSFLSKLLSRG